MGLVVKQAQQREPLAQSAVSPLPQAEIAPTLAPGKKGPQGTGPRTNYSRVNTGTPPTPDAGAESQKSMAPRGAEMLPQKVAFPNEESMGTTTQRPRLQDMVKAAMEASLDRVDITQEAARQAVNMGEAPSEKTAAATTTDVPTEKRASSDYALKLASAVEFIVENLGKQAAVENPPGVTQATKSETLPPHQGQAHHQPPMHPGLQKGLKTEQGATQLENTLDHPAGGHEKAPQTNYGKKTASSVVSLIRSKTKVAEDAISPAHISAGAAVPPETSAAGEPGGQPAGGAPQGATGLVSSNEAARNYTRGQAYADKKKDLKKYLDEPALSSETDKTLAQAFEHTSEAGTKFSSALSTKTAAAKALIAKLEEETTAAAQAEQRSA